ncbi:glycosyltransferase family 4 protein [Candidatus Woesearchaeota archaeon]|nr:glycosyltransferase family 4 protein [Candidatus Woesearchaeota archaeon]
MTKVMYISGTYAPSFGGAEISIHTLLKNISRKKEFEVEVLTNVQHPKANLEYEGIPIKGVNHENRGRDIVDRIILFKPDVIITQLIWSDIVLEICNRLSIPSILRIGSVPFNLDISKKSSYAPSEIIVPSDFVRDYVRDTWERESVVIPPQINVNRVLANKDPSENRYITLFNPLVKKGGQIFYNIAKSMPEYNFCVVKGWDMLKDRDGNFDDSKIEQICESLRIPYNGQRPKTVNNFPLNVKVIEPIDDVNQIYAQTRILCVPSICQETFSRTTMEGFANKIPVIGSNVGGLAKNVREGGIIVYDYTNPDEWIKTVKMLDESSKYSEYSEKGFDYFKREQNSDEITMKFERVLKS